MKKTLLITLLFMLTGLALSLHAEVKMPHIFGDNMVLQRNQKIKVWGWADKGESVTVKFNGQIKKVKADKNGKWLLELNPMQAGGPYKMEISGKKNKVEYNNILIGEVWVCSGQSNMEWVVANSNDAKKEIRSAAYPEIRAFNVEQKMSFELQDDFNGKWDVCSPETVGGFSAVGYFFARKLYQELDVPVGIINTSWGGTVIETWTSLESFRALPETYIEKFDNYLNSMTLDEFVENNNKTKEAYFKALENDFGLIEKWFDPGTDISSWGTMEIPSGWSSTELVWTEGYVWFRYDFDLEKEDAGKEAYLSLGPVDDEDITWFNGVKVGETGYYNIMRNYDIPKGLLRGGKNTIVVRVNNPVGEGGINGRPEDLFLTIGSKIIPLNGQWNYKPSVTNKAYGYTSISPNMYPSLLYNTMINPIINYGIKGAIWYQGEGNAENKKDAQDYKLFFPNMIQDWRSKWGYDFPFYWVQLANFMQKDEKPQDSNWALLREAQSATLGLPKTGQAVIADIGEADDIHPRNKQDVGLRLALIALNKDYGMGDIVYSGPTYKSMSVDGDKIILSFDNIGSGLIVRNKYGYVDSFAIAGADKKFYWAKAYIDGDNVVVYSDKVKNPVAVRYGWSNNPDINLYNEEDLPASPFRTDNW